jgi:hypothetical protein
LELPQAQSWPARQASRPPGQRQVRGPVPLVPVVSAQWQQALRARLALLQA